jgi:hypothetical protein
LFLRLPLPNPDGRFFAICRHVLFQKHRRPLASVPPVKILKISQLLNLREIENRRRQSTPLITTAPRKAKRFNIRYRRRQRRKTKNPSSAQPATATIETDSIDEVIIFSTRSLNAMALRNRKKYCWNGACIDTGAQRTVIGLAQARAYCKFLGILFALSINKRVFVFWVDKRNLLGILHMRLPTPNGTFIMLEVDIVPTNVPMLPGLDVLDKFGLCADTVHNVYIARRRIGTCHWCASSSTCTSNVPLQIEYFIRSQSCRNCIAIFRTHRRKTSSHCSSVQKLTTWMPTREQCLAISKMPVVPADATARNHFASKLHFLAERNYLSEASS